MNKKSINTEIDKMENKHGRKKKYVQIIWFFHKIYDHLMNMIEERREEIIRIERREKHIQKNKIIIRKYYI